MRNAKCEVRNGRRGASIHIAPQSPLYKIGNIYKPPTANCQRLNNRKIGEPIETNSVIYFYSPIRAIQCARRPPLRTTHFALRTQKEKPSRHYVSKRLNHQYPCIGMACFLSFFNAFPSIWRIRSRVTPKCLPTSSSVLGVPSSIPKRRAKTPFSLSVSVSSIL